MIKAIQMGILLSGVLLSGGAWAAEPTVEDAAAPLRVALTSLARPADADALAVDLSEAMDALVGRQERRRKAIRTARRVADRRARLAQRQHRSG